MVRLFLILSSIIMAFNLLGSLLYFFLGKEQVFSIEIIGIGIILTGILFVIDKVRKKWLDVTFISIIWLFNLVVCSFATGFSTMYGWKISEVIFLVVYFGILFTLTHWDKEINHKLGRNI